MPLKLVPPRKGKSPNWSIRGTHISVYVDRSTKTDRRSVAAKQLRDLKARIERGEFPEKRAEPNAPTFLSAAVAYIQAGRSRKGLAKLIEYFGETALTEINQQAIDAAAIAIAPRVTPATRNRKIYTPVSAVLRHAGIELKLRRPKNAKGRVVTDYLSPADVAGIIDAAESFDRELALLLRFLLYTGARLGEALRLQWDEILIEERLAYIRFTKNGDPRAIRLRADLCEDLASRRPADSQGHVFRFHQGGWLKERLLRAKLAACGLPPIERPKRGEKRRTPPHRLSWVNFHTFRHTYATWMRRYGGLDEIGLVATGNWRDPRSARRYAHAVPREEWNKVEMLPTVSRGKSVESR
jgi:integrase